MDTGLDKFSIRELLIIVIPGFYGTVIIAPLLNSYFTLSKSSDLVLSILFIVVSLSIGFLLYFIDFPKLLPFFKKNLPTSILEEEFQSIDKIKLHGIFYAFFDKEISEEQKVRTNFYTSTYHFSVNISVLSIIITICYAIFQNDYMHGYGLITAIIGILNITNFLGLFYGKRKIKYMFTRQIERFKSSQEYAKLQIR